MHHCITSLECAEIARGLTLLLEEKESDIDKLTEEGRAGVYQLRELFHMLSKGVGEGDGIESLYKIEYIGSKNMFDE